VVVQLWHLVAMSEHGSYMRHQGIDGLPSGHEHTCGSLRAVPRSIRRRNVETAGARVSPCGEHNQLLTGRREAITATQDTRRSFPRIDKVIEGAAPAGCETQQERQQPRVHNAVGDA
jgi:hypothetical protein